MDEPSTLPPLAPGDVVGDVRVLAVRKKTVPGKKYPSRTVDLECLLCGAQVLGRDYSGVSQSRLNGSRPACTPCTRKRLRRSEGAEPLRRASPLEIPGGRRMIVLGIDPGLRVTGLALVELPPGQARYRCIDTRSIRVKQGTPDDEARRLVTRAICNYQEITWAEVIGVEDYVWQGPRSANLNAFRLSKLVGAIHEAVSGWTETAPVLVAKRECNEAIGHSGECDDRDIRAGLALRFGGPVGRNAHERDAVLVALATAARHRVERRRRR